MGLPEKGQVGFPKDQEPPEVGTWLETLREALSQHPPGCNIENFDVSNVRWSVEDFQHLLQILQESRAILRRIKAFKCSLEDDSARHLAEWIRGLNPNKVPDEIHLSHNNLSSDGFLAILTAIEDQRQVASITNPSVYIRVEYNRIDPDLLDMLEGSKRVRFVNDVRDPARQYGDVAVAVWVMPPGGGKKGAKGSSKGDKGKGKEKGHEKGSKGYGKDYGKNGKDHGHGKNSKDYGKKGGDEGKGWGKDGWDRDPYEGHYAAERAAAAAWWSKGDHWDADMEDAWAGHDRRLGEYSWSEGRWSHRREEREDDRRGRGRGEDYRREDYHERSFQAREEPQRQVRRDYGGSSSSGHRTVRPALPDDRAISSRHGARQERFAPAPPAPPSKRRRLPPPWEEHMSEEYGIPFFWNRDTNESVWEWPPPGFQ